MNPNENARNRQPATLGDIKMLAENIGQNENNHRQLVGNINEIIQWVRSIDQAAFIGIHYQLHGTNEFNEENTQKTTDFIVQARENMQAFQKEQDDKITREALEAMGDNFVVQGVKFEKISELVAETPEHPAGTTFKYRAAGRNISEDEFAFAAQQAYGIQKQAEKEAADQIEKDKQIAANESTQAPAEAEAPADLDVAATEPQENASKES